MRRGGSWFYDSRYCTAGYRGGNNHDIILNPNETGPDSRNNDLGFRLVADQGEPVVQGLIRDMIAIPGKNFKMGKYEVTQKQWGAIMGNNPSNFKGDDNPVEQVSWNDCKAFLEMLNARPEVKVARLTFRLPTEAEWGYACRAGGQGQYCRLADGTEITESTLGKVAWYNKTSEGSTHPVGQKIPNAFGLYDMRGNVWEWCDGGGAGAEMGLPCSRWGGSWCNDSRCLDQASPADPGLHEPFSGFRLLATQK